MRAALATALVAALLGCGDDEPPLEPAFPADYATTYVEVRDCRPSGDHDLNNIRVLADPTSAAAYTGRDADFPVGAVLIKEEHDFGDTTCTGPPVQWTVMVRLAGGTAPATLDWAWQRVDRDRVVLSEDESRCIGCHELCGEPPDGYLGTCTVP